MINLNILDEQSSRLRAGQRGGVTVPVGDYVVRQVDLKETTDRHGRPLRIAEFEVVEGSEAGTKIESPVWGNAERLVAGAGAGRFLLHVYAHHGDDGREWRRVNVEAIRVCGEPVSDPEPVVVPDAKHIEAAATDFTCGFRCLGSIAERREIGDWWECYVAMSRGELGSHVGEIAYLSTFTFTTALEEHQAKNDSEDEARGKPKRGSLEGFDGPCFGPLLTFDIDCRGEDGNPDPAGGHHSAIALVVALLELRVAPQLIPVFFSGSKGFHIQIPSMLAGATPGVDFHLVAKEFCTLVAKKAGVVIDESLYRKLQPLRAPNSRHPKSGLYKVRLTLDELIDLPIEEILGLAKQPRPFEPPLCLCEPVLEVVSLWRQAEKNARAPKAPARHEESGGDSEARITRATWDYLINGAKPGTRAESHFKAAANLADFGSLDELVHALMRRPAVLNGWPAREAEGHVESALQRAVAHGLQSQQPGGSGARGDR